jgi:alcohol dehydrogenase class IV
MLNFEYQNPVKLLFGRGKLSLIGAETARWGKKALIVTSSSSGRTGLLAKVTDNLKAAGVEVAIYDKVKPNPLTTNVAAAVALLQKEKCDVIVGLGGGSSMDCAKGVAFSASNPGDFSEYIFGKPGQGALPIILITTTAGTGSEGNSLAVFTNPDNNDKKGMKSPYIYAKASIIDPELMTTLPPRVIASTGMDALFHSIEAYISKRHQPLSDLLALQSIRLLSANLPKVYANPADLDAWDAVALGNTLGGMVIDTAGTALPHAMEHPVSGLLNVSHGEGLAALYLPILRFNLPAAPERMADIAAVMGEKDVVAAVRKLGQSINIPLHLGQLGVEAKHIDWMAENAFKTMKAAIDNNPRSLTLDDVKNIYRESL